MEKLEQTISEMKLNAPVRDVVVEEIWENQRRYNYHCHSLFRLPMIMSWSEKNLLPTEREHWSDHLVIHYL